MEGKFIDASASNAYKLSQVSWVEEKFVEKSLEFITNSVGDMAWQSLWRIECIAKFVRYRCCFYFYFFLFVTFFFFFFTIMKQLDELGELEEQLAELNKLLYGLEELLASLDKLC